MIKWLNQHPKFRSLAFWTSLVAALVMIANQVSALLGYQIGPQIGQAQDMAMTVITLLASLGVLIVPPQSQQETKTKDQSQNL